MKRLLCAVIFTAMTVGTARAADDALTALKLSVSPSALENIVLPSPASAAEMASMLKKEQSSASDQAVTRLNEETIKGEYLVQTAGMPELRVTLADVEATIVMPQPDGNLVCKGTYKYDVEKSLLNTQFNDCGGSSFSHIMAMEGQTVESLSAGANVIGTLRMDGDITPAMPVKIKKVK